MKPASIKEAKEQARLGGGSEKIAKQYQQGKLTARERIDLLLDPGSFMELDMFATHRCVDFEIDKKRYWGDGVVVGSGYVDKRLIFVTAQDFTVLGGSLGEMHARKISKTIDLALQNGAPIVHLLDSGGARIQEGPAYYGMIFYRSSMCSGIIPQISAVLGPCSGGAAISAAMSDFVFMVDGISTLFSTGPRVVETMTGEKVSAQELGSAEIHSTKSGIAHFRTGSERECFKLIKKLLDFLPSSNKEIATKKQAPLGDQFSEVVDWNSLLSKDIHQPYDMRKIVSSLVDGGDFFEIQAEFAKNILVGFSRIAGDVVGIIANQPSEQLGLIDMDASDKCARFIRFCDAFNIPMVNLVDSGGYLSGKEAERSGAVRHMAKMTYAYSEATVPRIVIITGKVYGGAISGMGVSKMLGTDISVALSTAEIGVMEASSAVSILYSKELREIKDKEERENFRKQKIKEYHELFQSPFKAAEKGWIDDIIEPDEMRSFLVSALTRLKKKTELRHARRHGCMPL